MKLNLGILLVLCLISLISEAQSYLPGKIFSGITPNNQNCRLQLNSVSDGWTVELENKTNLSKLLFNSHRKIEINNSAWISQDVMAQVSDSHFESSANLGTANKLFNISMRCKLNALNEPIAFTLDVQETSPINSFKRVVNCQIQ